MLGCISLSQASTDRPGTRETAMTDKLRSEFERNRERLAYLCREMIERIWETSDDSSIGEIGPLTAESEPLATSLGFAGPPIKFYQRSEPHYRYVRLLIWNDPHGTRGGEIRLSAPSDTVRLDAVASRSKAEDRATLISVLERWIRAVDGAVEPLGSSTPSTTSLGGGGDREPRPVLKIDIPARTARLGDKTCEFKPGANWDDLKKLGQSPGRLKAMDKARISRLRKHLDEKGLKNVADAIQCDNGQYSLCTAKFEVDLIEPE